MGFGTHPLSDFMLYTVMSAHVTYLPHQKSTSEKHAAKQDWMW